jgi:hypothetical protein
VRLLLLLLFLVILAKNILIIQAPRRFPNPILIILHPKIPNIQNGGIIPIARGDTPTPFKHHLPHPSDAC